MKKQGLLVDDIATLNQLAGQILEVGGEDAFYKGTDFLNLYHRQRQEKVLPFELTEFNAVIFPSTASLRDFTAALDSKQIKQLKDITAFVMGQSIDDLARKVNFKKVVNCQPNVEATIKQVKEELTGD